MTIRHKLILWYSGLLALIIIAFGSTLYGMTRYVLVASVDRTLAQTVEEVWSNTSAALIGQFGSRDTITIQIPEIDVFRASGVVVQVWDMSDGGQRLARASSNLASYDQPLDQEALVAHAVRDVTSIREHPMSMTDMQLNGSHWRVLTRPVDILGRRVVIQTASSMQAIDQVSQSILTVMLISSSFALAGSMLLGWILSNRAMQPVLDLTHAAEQIVSARDLSTRLPWSGPRDEMGQLTNVFNMMMERLQHVFSVQQRFVADVSHELRTPLTAIRGHLELIQRYGMDAESLEAVQDETERMARLVNDLLLLAKADYGGLSLNQTPLDLQDLLGDIYREAKVLARDRTLNLTIGDYDSVRINGDPDRMRQLLLNLVSNAIRFTPDGGAITLNLRREAYEAVIEVRDTGIGMNDDDQRRVFDRFFQAETSRTRSVGKEGTGLGLSIAKWIAEAHGGTICVTSAVGTGTRFTVTLPHIEPRPLVAADAVTRLRLHLPRRTATLNAVKVAPPVDERQR